MKPWKRRLFFSVAAIVCLCIVSILLCMISADLVVDLFWFDSLNYESYFWMRLLYRYAIFAAATLLFFSIFFFNFRIASRFSKTVLPSVSKTDSKVKRAYRALIDKFQAGSIKLYMLFSLVIALFAAYPLFRRWEDALFYIFGSNTGMRDAVFNKDIGYYLFSFPIYNVIQRRSLIAFLILLLLLAIIYWLQSRLLPKEKRRIPTEGKIHLAALIIIVSLIQSWGYILQRYSLLYTNNHQPYFSGPGFVEIEVALPLIWLELILFLIFAFSFIFFINKRKGIKILLVSAACFIIIAGIRYYSFLPNMVEKYIVKPGKTAKERPFIKNSIKSTLAAYGLDNVETRIFSTDLFPQSAKGFAAGPILDNIPVWDKDLLGGVYKQLQGIRPYYAFTEVSVDRYTVEQFHHQAYQQVNLSLRELNPVDLPSSALTWENLHLRYTHGKGAVITPAAQSKDESMIWFLYDMPPKSDYGFNIEQPDIYYGLVHSSYVLSPNDTGEVDYPKLEADVFSDYEGRGGVPCASLFKKFLFSVYFKDKRIFFTTKTNDKSRILFRRNIKNRIKYITPYFLMDKEPYPAVTSKGLFWIQDACTISSMYPCAELYNDQFNYIRNSVKIVVDAYNGSVTYYIAYPDDPIIQAYQRMYPGLLKSLDMMPSELKEHIRYPVDFFETQMSIYAKYHQADPELFFRQENIWDFAKTIKGQKDVRMKPYYLTLNLINPDKFDFLLFLPMSSRGRDNLRSMVIAGCDGNNYGKIINYSFSKKDGVPGPARVNALINQNAAISSRLALYSRISSKMIRGRMIILPIGNTIFYIQPVYLQDIDRFKILHLKQIIMSQGEVVVMESSLEKAFQELEKISASSISRESG